MPYSDKPSAGYCGIFLPGNIWVPSKIIENNSHKVKKSLKIIKMVISQQEIIFLVRTGECAG